MESYEKKPTIGLSAGCSSPMVKWSIYRVKIHLFHLFIQIHCQCGSGASMFNTSSM
jgi:hypothetical protein